MDRLLSSVSPGTGLASGSNSAEDLDLTPDADPANCEDDTYLSVWDCEGRTGPHGDQPGPQDEQPVEDVQEQVE